MREVDNKYKCLPFWAWNGELDEEKLVKEIEWMNQNGVGGFFMHARYGLSTPYLGEKWFKCVDACVEKAKELGMEPYAYDENGWPSGFAGGKLLEDIENHDMFIEKKEGEFDKEATVSYAIKDNKLIRVNEGENVINLYVKPSPSTADVCNPEVVSKFINETHEKYKANDEKIHYLKGFFTDEPQYFRWGMPYSKMMAKHFKEQYNEDILDKLGLLFIKAEGYEDFRYKYYLAMNNYFTNSFSKQIYEWCEENGYKFTGHYVAEDNMTCQMHCVAGIMNQYEYEHIPGVDLIGRYCSYATFECVRVMGSVADQLGKKQRIVESYACCGWDVTPMELKGIGEHVFIDGVNLMCQHLIPYESHGERKRDYPAHYCPTNTWIKKNFKEFNDYFSVLGEMLANSKERVNVAVFMPIRSMYIDFKYDDEWEAWKYDESLNQVIIKLEQLKIPYHFIDESVLERHGKIEGNKFVCGLCSYDYVIIPMILTMGKHFDGLLQEYVRNGGKLMCENVPTLLEGQKHTYDYFVNNFTYEDLVNSVDYHFDGDRNNILSSRVDNDGRLFFYIVNFENESNFNLKVDGYKSFKRYDIMNDKYTVVGSNLHLDKYESMILYPCNEEIEAQSELEELRLGNKYVVEGNPDNYFGIDYLRFSIDGGKTYSKPLQYMGVFNELLNLRYDGEVLLKYEFDTKVLPSRMRLLLEDEGIKNVFVNGVEIKEHVSSEIEEHLFIYDVKDQVKLGHNEIVVKIHFFENQMVYDALFDKKGTESLLNMIYYDTTIEQAVLCGDFGVYGDIFEGDSPDTLRGRNFYLDAPKKEITSLINDGYPMIRGDIKLSQEVEIDDVNKQLVIDGRFQLIDLYVNDEFVDRLMFNYKVDLSKHLKVGKNKISLVLSMSNRNLCGPSHGEKDEPQYIGPFSWDLRDTWTDGVSSKIMDYYTLVKTII